MPIIENIIATTNYKDKYLGLTKEQLDKMAEDINKSNSAMAVNLNHDNTKIIGKVLRARVEPYNDEGYCLICTMTIFNIKRELKYKDEEFIEFTSEENDNRPFTVSKSEKFTVYIDPNNFSSENELNEFIKLLKSEFGDIEVEYHLRYSVFPDPTLIFDFGKDILLGFGVSIGIDIGKELYKRMKSKITNCIVDYLENKIFQTLISLKKSNIKENIKPSNKPMNLCPKMDIGVVIEIILKFNSPNFEDINILNRGAIIEIIKKSYEYKDVFGATCIQYIIDGNELYLNYIMTEDGRIIYSKKGFENLKNYEKNQEW